jgi:starch synthase (maltosyl-transferring)
MYAGYELVESVARTGVEEHVDSEKYEYKPRDFEAAEKAGTSLAPYVTKLNEIRNAHPALAQLRNIEFHSSEDGAILVYSKHLCAEHTANGKPDTVIVVVNTDPHAVRETMVTLDLWKLGLPDNAVFDVTDLITGETWNWGTRNYVRLDPAVEPVHILRVDRKK